MRHNFLALLGHSLFFAPAASVFARRRWSFVAGACLVAAVALWLTLGLDAAFVAATLGLVAWFWDQRNRYRPLVIKDETEDEQGEDDNIDETDWGKEAGEDGERPALGNRERP